MSEPGQNKKVRRASTSEKDENNASDKTDPIESIDLQSLAQEVYNLLKSEIRIENER